jgi:solute carrier family 13 (sodium-dependent dicarboxylate transporter), member 2/3/5
LAQATTLRDPEALENQASSYAIWQRIGLFGGPLLFLICYFFVRPEGMPLTATTVLASTAWVATWWITEAMPIPVTSLLPLVLFPVLGVAKMSEVAAPYSDPTVYLFLGGFLVALAVERWNLHRRIALNVISLLGISPGRLVLGFMTSTAVLSMWLSNTATAMMMLPIGLAVVTQIANLQKGHHDKVVSMAAATKSNFGTALMLSIAYGASLGGIGTLIGTPPNAVFAGVAAKMGMQVGFLQWMILAVPIMVVMMAVTWFVLMKVFPSETGTIPGGKELIRQELKAMGAISKQEKWALTVFATVSFLWIARPYLVTPYLPMVDDSVIAIFGGVLLFLIPINMQKNQWLLTAEAVGKIPWGILLLFGAGFSIAGAFQTSGLSKWMAQSLTGLQGVGYLWVLLALCTLVIFLTEVTSNTAIATLFMPIVASLGTALGVAPVGLMVTTALAASFAFMLPVATPPNAIVFSSGYVSIKDMAKAGLWLNLAGIVVIVFFAYVWLPLVWK